MKAVVLAAGEGTRLKPFTENMPKVMLPVANKPILEYVIDALAKSGVRDIIMVVGYKKERVMQHFGDGKKFGIEIKYAIQEEQVGTCHALLQAEKYIDDEPFLVLPGDNLIDEKLLFPLINENHDLALIVAKHSQPSKYGVVEIGEGFIKSIVEKPKEAKSNIVSTGIYKLNLEILNFLKECGKSGIYSLTNAIQMAIENGYSIKGIEKEGKWMDVVYPWDLIHANAKALQEILQSISGKIEENVVIKGKVYIGEDTIIRSGSYIVGPVIIGKNCEIGPNVCIFPSTSIGDNVTIGPFTQIKNSVLMDNISISSNGTISNSVIGKGCSTGSHFSILEGDSIVKVGEEYVKLENVGAFVGDDARIKSNVTINPGRRIGTACEIESGNIIREDIEDGAKVI